MNQSNTSTWAYSGLWTTFAGLASVKLRIIGGAIGASSSAVSVNVVDFVRVLTEAVDETESVISPGKEVLL